MQMQIVLIQYYLSINPNQCELWVMKPLSPQNPKDKKGSKYDKSRKIKVLRDFLFSSSDIRKTQKSPVWTEYRY